MPLDLSPLWLSLRYAGLATLLATIVALPLAWLLAHRRFPGCELLDAAANLPLLFPPAVLAYYLLFMPAFRWWAAVALSTLYTFPLLLRMSRAGFEALDPAYENAACILGAAEWRVFWRITVPLTWRALIGAILAGFARAFVDFAATTLVARSANDDAAFWILLLAGVTALGALYFGNRLRRAKVWA